MSGRIRDEVIVSIRERLPIEQVIGDYVQLRPAGAGRMKGLCPFHDEKTPSFNVNGNLGFFHCLAGETRVITWEGVREIRELAGGTHRVLGRDANWVDAPFRSFGIQRLMKITLGRNGQKKEIFATDEHRWFLRRSSKSRAEVLTKDLRPGDRLVSVYPRRRTTRTIPSAFGIAHGITYGDGCLAVDGARAALVGAKDAQLKQWFPRSPMRKYGDVRLVFGLPRYFKTRPSLDESTQYLYGWLSGYFAADGCVAKDGTVMLNSAQRSDLEFVRDVCTRLGIGTYGVTMQMREGLPAREPSALYRVHLVNEDLDESFFQIDKHADRFVEATKAFSRRGWVVQSVEETDRVEEVYCAVVEAGHAFVLEDNILTGNCFGCGKSGDAISFVRELDHLSFTDAVEVLARKAGVEVVYEQGGAAPRQQSSQRQRLLDAHKEAAAFFVQQLASPEAEIGRAFLRERGFDDASWLRFGVGYAPNDWEGLTRHLRSKGYTNAELLAGGLATQGQRGTPYDRFRGRLVWPIRDMKGDVIGFGARRLREDDQGPKYLNTPETPLYKKSQVLYGVDLAKNDIASRYKAVVVEGYTDVMACHLAGETTAVATCGTAFGVEHIQILRRLLMDQDEFRGRVIFTFDGDEAGRKAALKAFGDDQRFVTQTFVAVEPGGLDPCDLRQQRGDLAVRDLIASHVPLAEFAIRSTLERFDLNIPEGRVQALAAAGPVVATLKDWSLRDEYARRLAGWLGMDEQAVLAKVRGGDAGSGQSGGQQQRQPRRQAQPAARPDPRDPGLIVEREVAKLAVQRPALLGPEFDALDAVVFTAPAYAAVRTAVAKAGGAAIAVGGPDWVTKLQEVAETDSVRDLVTELAVEALQIKDESDPRYAGSLVARLEEMALTRQIQELKSRLQRLNPVEAATEYNRLFGELIVLEQRKKGLRERGIGGL